MANKTVVAPQALNITETPAVAPESVDGLKAEIAELKAEIAELKAEIAELKAAVPVKREAPCVDIVVVPVDPNASVPKDIVFDGERCLRRPDEHGFTHFLVPVVHAGKLLPLNGALKYVLAEAEKPLSVKLPAGLYNKDVEFLPHEYKGGKWTPIKNKAKNGDA